MTSHYCVPTRPGWCRHFVATVAQREQNTSNKVRQHRWFKLNLFTLTSPAWLTHVLGPTFLHQDMVLLHSQERIIARGEGQAMAEKWKEQVFIPTGADKMTVMFYQWFGKHGPVPWAGVGGSQVRPEWAFPNPPHRPFTAPFATSAPVSCKAGAGTRTVTGAYRG